MAERLGFEPRARVTPRNGFRDRPYQPLWHLSVRAFNYMINMQVDGDKPLALENSKNKILDDFLMIFFIKEHFVC
jgi:hypothetical protein